MKTRFIKINDISEINTSKANVRDLNNRYIDAEGNMYGLKYNRTARKVEVIKIIRTPAKSADYYQQILVHQKKTGAVKRERPELNNEEYYEISDDGSAREDIKGFEHEVFINQTMELMQTHKDRLAGIMMNIKNSRVIADSDRMSASQMNEIFRNIDIDGIQRMDKVLTTYKEIKNYPRSLTYYLSKLDNDSREVIDKLDTDSRKMAYVYCFEMYYLIRNQFKALSKMLKDLNYFLDSQKPDEIKDLTFVEKQSFFDARTSVANSIAETDRVLLNAKKLGDILKDSKNF